MIKVFDCASDAFFYLEHLLQHVQNEKIPGLRVIVTKQKEEDDLPTLKTKAFNLAQQYIEGGHKPFTFSFCIGETTSISIYNNTPMKWDDFMTT